MLILSRRPGESLLIGPNVTVTLLSIRGAHARLGVEAPKEVPVHRTDAVVRFKMPSQGATDSAAEALRRIRMDYYAALCLFHLADLGVADALSTEPLSARQLAETVGADPDALGRAMRFVATRGVFMEDADGRFRHNTLSLLLRGDHPQSQRAAFRLGATPLSGAISAEMGHSLRTGEPAAEIAAPEGLFDYLSQHPEQALVFDEARTAKVRADIAAILRVYDFTGFRSIADIGGGRGLLLRAILSSAPAARGILLDLPRVIGAGGSLMAGRLTLEGGDFFKDPLPTCDAYLLMNVIHEWPDAQAVAILEAIRCATPRNATLLILEAEMRAGPEPTTAKLLDVLTLGWSRGRERTKLEYRDLLDAAGFRLRRTLPVTPDLSIFEATVRERDS